LDGATACAEGATAVFTVTSALGTAAVGKLYSWLMILANE
jgi:hypothetical protein